MSTAKIDHAAEARNLLASISGRSTDAVKLSALAAVAQVHATLALVEQQRAANVIAYTSNIDVLVEGHKDWIEEAMGL